MRTVNHNGGKTAVNAGLADFKAVAVVKMNANRKAGVLESGLDEFH